MNSVNYKTANQNIICTLATLVWFFSFSMNFILLAKSRYEKGMIFSEKYDFLEYIATFGPFCCFKWHNLHGTITSMHIIFNFMWKKYTFQWEWMLWTSIIISFYWFLELVVVFSSCGMIFFKDFLNLVWKRYEFSQKSGMKKVWFSLKKVRIE